MFAASWGKDTETENMEFETDVPSLSSHFSPLNGVAWLKWEAAPIGGASDSKEVVIMANKGRSPWTVIGWSLAAVLIVVGLVLQLALGMDVSQAAQDQSKGWFAEGLWASGVFSAGLFSVGIYSIGIFSIGVFSLGIFSIGIFSLGIFAIGWYVAGQYIKGKMKTAK